MSDRGPRFRLSLMSILLAGLWQSPCVYAQDNAPSEFLDAIGRLVVPAPVSNSPNTSVVEGKTHRVQKKTTPMIQAEVSRNGSASAALQRENKTLRRRLAQKEEMDTRQKRQRIGTRSVADTQEAKKGQPGLMVQLSTMQGRLDNQIAALKAMTQTRDALADEVRQLTASNKALAAKANREGLAIAPDNTTQAALKALRKKLAQAEKRIVMAVQSEGAARATVLTSEIQKLKASADNTNVEMARLRQQVKEQFKSQTSGAQELAQREALQSQIGALSVAQQQLKDHLATQDASRRVLQSTITALLTYQNLIQKRASSDGTEHGELQDSVRTVTEKLTAAQGALAQQAARNGELEKQKAALAEAVEKGAAQKKQLAALQAQLDAATAASAELKSKLATVQAERTQATAGLAGLQAQFAASTKTNSTLREQLAALQVEKARLVAANGDADKAAAARVGDVLKADAGLRGQVATLTSARDAAQKSADVANAALSAAQTLAQATKVQADKMQAGRLAELQTQLAEATKSNTALKEQLASQAQTFTAEAKRAALAASPAPSATVPDLNTPGAQQAYASGVMMADVLRRTLALQNDLGEKPDTALLLAGVKDGVTGAVRLDKRVLTTQSEAVVARLSAKEKAKYDSGVKRLEALTAKQTLLKRNGTMFFVQVRKGGRLPKEGEALSISLRESTLDGRVLREGKARRGVYSTGLPYPVQQALMLGGLGGSVDIYCFASDIYPPNEAPAGVFAYTLMKYTVTSQP